ncbi:MAG: DNA repair protein RecN [Bacteroidales bacterium]
MISNLKIRNYALIESLEIGFKSGYITITGETGAGKSILMGALSLILGQRADSSMLLRKDEKCIVEGQFSTGKHLKPFFDTNDLDFETESFLRREILPGGKSRAFINDTPVTLNLLKELGDQLVDIHSQHQNLQLNDHIYQLSVVDYVSENSRELDMYRMLYENYMVKRAEHKKQKEEIDKISGELDFYQYQYEELSKADLKTGEMEELEQEITQLDNAEEIKLSLTGAGEALTGEGKALNLLNDAVSHQKKAGKVHTPSTEFASRLESAYIELKDIAGDMLSLAERIEYDPEKLEQLKGRMDLIYSLMQKHRLKDIQELIELREQLNEKITAITFSDEHLKKLEREIEIVYTDLLKLAENLHITRKKTGAYIEKIISDQLMQLGIPNAMFRVKVDKTDTPDRNGMNDVRFLFSANKQAPPKEISKVASGGEISRLMLTIKSLLSNFKGLPTLIFDEIDAGVSGEIAEKMGSIMKQMSGGRQVIAITHLPQVASQGEEHFLVYKEEEENSTVTHIRKLSRDERITEIAKLLSGEKITEAAISNARELLNY